MPKDDKYGGKYDGREYWTDGQRMAEMTFWETCKIYLIAFILMLASVECSDIIDPGWRNRENTYEGPIWDR